MRMKRTSVADQIASKRQRVCKENRMEKTISRLNFFAFSIVG